MTWLDSIQYKKHKHGSGRIENHLKKGVEITSFENEKTHCDYCGNKLNNKECHGCGQFYDDFIPKFGITCEEAELRIRKYQPF